MPTIDFSGVSIDFEPVEEGRYNGIFESYEYRAQSKSSGQPYVVMAFRISEGDHEGRKFFRNFSLQKQSLWALKRVLVRLGVDGEELGGPIDIDDIMPEVTGAPCVLVIGTHLYEDEIRNDVKDILSATEIV